MTQSSLWQPSDIMSAEAGNEPEAPKRRGRIPQSALPHILERHRAGATLSAIAREFDCTPSAISYIVRKAEASGMEPAAPSDNSADSQSGTAEETSSTEEPATEAVPAEAATGETITVAPSAERSEQPAVEPPAPLPPPEVQPSAESQPIEPRPVERRAATPEGRTQLRASDLGRLQQPVQRTPDPIPAPSASAEARPAPVASPPVAGADQPRPQEAGKAPAARAEPAPPVDAVEGRLRDTARSCLVAYRGWKQAPGENSIQTLHDAVHELRKALARIEIDMSASRRDEQVNRPIPIPAHRAARRPR